MPNYVYSNPYADAADAFSGAGAVFGNTLLRISMMQQQQQERQQELMLHLLQLQQRQGEFAQSHQLATDEFGFRQNQEARRKEEADRTFGLQQQTEARLDRQAASEEAWRSEEVAGARQKREGQEMFAGTAGLLGLPAPTEPFTPPATNWFPTLGAARSIPTDPYSADRMAQIGIAHSLPPSQALDTILKLQAMRQHPMDTDTAATILTGRAPDRGYNVPPGGTFVDREGKVLYQSPLPSRMESPLNYPQIVNAAQLVAGTNSAAVQQDALRGMAEQMRRARIALSGTNAPAGAQQPQLPSPRTQAEYDALPPGTVYVHPSGAIKTKQ